MSIWPPQISYEVDWNRNSAFEVTVCDQPPDPRQVPFCKYTRDWETGIVIWNGKRGDQDGEEVRVTVWWYIAV